MDLTHYLQYSSGWTVLKIMMIALVVTPNATLVIKILSRPRIHTIFNLSLVGFFAVIAGFGPPLIHFYFEVLDQNYSTKNDHLEADHKSNCARLMEFQNIVQESLRIIGVNLLFRFFYVLYADRGLTLNGSANTALLKWIYVLFTLGTKGEHKKTKNFWTYVQNVSTLPTYRTLIWTKISLDKCSSD